MKYFLPDQETLDAIFGAYVARGLRFELYSMPFANEAMLKVLFAKGSDAAPLLPLPVAEMQTPEAALQWLEHLRDNQLVMAVRGVEW